MVVCHFSFVRHHWRQWEQTFIIRFNNLWFVIQNTVYRFVLIYLSSSLCLPLQGMSNYSHTLLEKQFLSTTTTKPSKHVYNAWDKQYFLLGPTPKPVDINASSSGQNCIGEEGNNSDQSTYKCNMDITEFPSSKRLTVSHLTKIHLQLRHAPYTQMQSFIRRTALWSKEYTDDIEWADENCPCVLSTLPSPWPGCSKSQLPETNQSDVSIDFVYLHTKSILHCIDNQTRCSELCILRSRRLEDQINVSKGIQLYRQNMRETIREDRKYNKPEFKAFRAMMEFMLTFTTAKYHEGYGTVGRANHTLKSHFSILALPQPQLTLIDLVTAAILYKSTAKRHNNASAFELFYRIVPNLSSICDQTSHGSQEENSFMDRRLELHASLQNNVQNWSFLIVGQSVYFWRGSNGWTVTAIILKVHQHAVNIAHAGMRKTADHNQVRATPMSRIIAHHEPAPPLKDSTDHSWTAKQQDCADANDEDGELSSVDINPGNTKKLTREAKQLGKEIQKIIEELHKTRNTIKRLRNYLV